MPILPWILLSALAPTSTASAEDDYALLVKTADPEIAALVLSVFGGTDMPDELADGEHHMILVDDEGEATLVKGQGEIGMLRLDANPSTLMGMFGQQVEQYKAMASMMASMSAAQGGADPAQVQKLVNDLFAFPKQVARLSLAIDGGEDAPIDARIDLFPADGSGFAGFVSALNPNQEGAPTTMDGADVAVAVAVAPDSLQRVIGPLVAIGGGATGANYGSLMKAWMPLLDGSFSLSLKGTSSQMIAGCKDGAALSALLNGSEYAKMVTDMLEQNPNVESELTLNALTHRGVSLLRNNISTGTPSPFAPDGEMTQYMGVAGDYMVATLFGGTEDEIKGLVDRAVDDKIGHRALPKDSVMSLAVNAKSLAKAAGVPERELGEVPDAVNVLLGRHSDALRISLAIQ